MSDKKFNSLLNRLANANQKYKELLFEAEDEFYRRYNAYPGDIDFDLWIDAYHVGAGHMSAEEIEIKMNDGYGNRPMNT